MIKYDRIASRIASRYAAQKIAGAVEFEVFIQDPHPRSAFQKAQEDAEDDRGFDRDDEDDDDEGYSGTILEKGSYSIRSESPMSMPEARRFVMGDFRNAKKWGPAFAVPVGRGSKIEGWIFYGIASS